jgi:signal transduction histidine kinase
MDDTFLRTRLFRPFETTKGAQGMGIGAYEAREFIRKCNGNIEVKSAPGQGTSFTITLPLAAALSADPGAVPQNERFAS